MKKNNKKLIIILGILVGISIVLILLFNNKNNDELIIGCQRTVQNEDSVSEFFIDVYEDDNSLKIVNNTTTTLNSKMSEEALDLMFTYYKTKQEQTVLNKFDEDYQYFEHSIEKLENGIKSTFVYYINEKNQTDMYEVFEYNFFGSSMDDINNYFEEDGFTCKIY